MAKNERIEKRKNQVKSDIIVAAENLFKIKPVKEVTMEDIASEALYSKAAIYQYFSSKEEIMLTICIKGLKILETMFNNGLHNIEEGLEKISELGEQHYKFMTQYEFYFLFLHNLPSIDSTDPKLGVLYQELKEIDDSINKMMLEAINLGKQDGSINNLFETNTLCYLLKSMSSGVYSNIRSMKFHNAQIHLTDYEIYQEFKKFVEYAIKGSK